MGGESSDGTVRRDDAAQLQHRPSPSRGAFCCLPYPSGQTPTDGGLPTTASLSVAVPVHPWSSPPTDGDLGRHRRRRGPQRARDRRVPRAAAEGAGARGARLRGRRHGGLWPGFRVSTAAYVVSLFRPEIVRDLELARHGYQLLPRNPSSFTPFPDGRSLLMGPDPELNHREVSKFSVRDAEPSPARGDAGTDRRRDRADDPRDPGRPVLRRPGDLFRLARMGVAIPPPGEGRTAGAGDPDRPGADHPRSVVRVRSAEVRARHRRDHRWLPRRHRGPPMCSSTT